LIAAFLFGVPIAGTTRPPGEEFSILQAFKQAGIVTAIVLVVFMLNVAVARAFSLAMPKAKTDSKRNNWRVASNGASAATNDAKRLK
jgi:hypothetical protein